MKMRMSFCLIIQCFFIFTFAGQIDRKALVDRHKVITYKTNSVSPAQVGNGEFAFGVDITGLQTFVPFNTLSNWSWHNFPLPNGMKPEDFKRKKMWANNRWVEYDVENPEQPELSKWLACNPHRFNLGRIGLNIKDSNGKQIKETDLQNTYQEIDLWNGIITSSFLYENKPVTVKTICHQNVDAIAVVIESPLLLNEQISVFIDFPYGDGNLFSNYVGNYDKDDLHISELNKISKNECVIERVMDDAHYFTSLKWETSAILKQNDKHRFELLPLDSDKLLFVCLFSQKKGGEVPSLEDVVSNSKKSWKNFWNSGAAIDLSGSSDARWFELERRIVLSQYLMKVNEAGSLPPQESGLVNNGWYGRFHFEMIWWHGVHYALWNRWNLWDKSLTIYRKFLKTSKERAQRQGYKGVRWPKCTGNIDREWPSLIHGTLIWQEPHPIYFAELDYRLHPNKNTLEKWKEIVFSSADFMADLVYNDGDKLVLGPPLYIVSENTDPVKTINPTFELSYWRTGLRIAQDWKKRLNQTIDHKWENVMNKLSPLPIDDGVYVTYEGISDMWEKYTFEHPGLTGVYGMLPGDGVDRYVFYKTLMKVFNRWDFNRTWGWDFPMLAMAAARCGNPMMAIDFLLHPSRNFSFDEHGLASGGPFPYFPSNGGLLTAVAMMAGGWDGSVGFAPGFPKDGSWNVKVEGFIPMMAYNK